MTRFSEVGNVTLDEVTRTARWQGAMKLPEPKAAVKPQPLREDTPTVSKNVVAAPKEGWSEKIRRIIKDFKVSDFHVHPYTNFGMPTIPPVSAESLANVASYEGAERLSDAASKVWGGNWEVMGVADDRGHKVARKRSREGDSLMARVLRLKDQRWLSMAQIQKEKLTQSRFFMRLVLEIRDMMWELDHGHGSEEYLTRLEEICDLGQVVTVMER